ncbi:response regulator [bacterium]|nr:response regulator [bacterium]
MFLCQCRHAQRPAVLAVIHDITAYTSAEHALFQSQHMFQWVLNTIPQRVFWKDRDYRYLGCNRAFLEDAGLSDPSQLIGKTDLDLHWRDIAELYHADDRWVVENINAKLGYEEPLVRPDGSLRWLRVSKVPLFDAEGQVVGVLGVYEDITEAKGAEERQRKLEAQVQYAAKLESLGVLAGGIAHDFNNLLTGILGHADLALAELSPVSPARENLEQIEASARRAAELTRQMLAYSGRGRYFVQTTRIGEVINEMVRLLEISVSPKCVLKYRFRPDVPSIEVDVAQLRQVVMNLVVNASEAIGDKSGVITLSTGVMHCDAKYLSESYLDEGLPEGDYVYLEVADTGCGMDGETRARVFDPFFSTKFTGRGLGLAAVLGIVRAHRGAIKVYSEPGRGSTFKVLFPAAPVRAEGAVPRHATDAWQGHGAILVVDDEPMVRALAQRMLSRCGFEVTLASDGREALEIFRRDPAAFRLVLLDMTMPNMDGEETFRELRHIRPDVTVVLSSGYNEHEATHRFAGKGLAGFIQKPYRMDELARAVRQALGEI